MKREVSEWVDKAEGDFISAKREFRYPGECASQEVAKEAITLSSAVRDELRQLLSLSQN